MYATIQKWGNSQGLRIPKALLDAVGLKEHDRVELVQKDDGINIRRASSIPHRTLEERLTAFYGKPIDQIDRIEAEEDRKSTRLNSSHSSRSRMPSSA